MRLPAIIIAMFSTMMFVNGTERVSPGQGRDAFDDCWPKRFVFRGEYMWSLNSEYPAFVQSGMFSDGYIQKYVPYDEAYKVHPSRTAGFVSRLKHEDPSKTMLLHWDAEEHVNNIPESSSKYFPGHWITYEGSRLSSDLTRSATEIYVDDIAPFAVRTRNKKARSEWECPVLMIVAVDPEGNPDWKRHEYVAIDDVDEAAGKITVRRAQALSEAMAFPEGSRVSPMPTYLSSEHLFMFNYSTLCPRDENGHNAVDVQLEELFGLFDSRTGLLKDLDGISFDVLNWQPPCDRSRIDSDGDGKADGAVDPVTGEDLWQTGAYRFQRELRAHFGEDFILLNDSYARRDQRALGIFNGFESEGLVRHNDAFRGFSKTVNIYSYWMKNNPLDNQLYTIVPKLKNPEDMDREEQFLRLCAGTATCLGAALNTPPAASEQDIQDELKGGKLNKPHWLGRPVGDMVNLGLDGHDLLRDSGPAGLAGMFVPDKNITETADGIVRISSHGSGRYDDKCEFRTVTFHIPENVDNIVLSFDIMSGSPVRGMSADVPKIVSVEAVGLPVYEKNTAYNGMYNDMWGLCGTKGYDTQTFLYRQVGGKDLSFRFEIEGGGDYFIRNLCLRVSDGVLYREFENGVVIVNPSFSAVPFDLDVFGDWTFRRIDGSSSVNDGETVTGTVIEIPGLDSVFLMKAE